METALFVKQVYCAAFLTQINGNYDLLCPGPFVLLNRMNNGQEGGYFNIA